MVRTNSPGKCKSLSCGWVVAVTGASDHEYTVIELSNPKSDFQPIHRLSKSVTMI